MEGTGTGTDAAYNLTPCEESMRVAACHPGGCLGLVFRPLGLNEPHLESARARPPPPWPGPVLALSPSVRRDQHYTLTCKNAFHLQKDGVRGGRRGFGDASIRHHCSRMSERGDRSGRPDNVRAARGACRSAMHVWTSRIRGCTARTVPLPKDCGSCTPARVPRGAGLPPGLETGVWNSKRVEV